MKVYYEITLKLQPEIPLYFLWEKVYQQVHLALVEVQDDERRVSIGAAFPEYDAKRPQLGCKLRLFGVSLQELEQLDLAKWLSRLQDYVHCSSIREVPENSRYGHYKRLQAKSSNSRMARRKAKREGIRLEEATLFFANRNEQTRKAPFIHLKSLSSEKRFRLMIGYLESKESSTRKFSAYGLSSESTVPIF